MAEGGVGARKHRGGLPPLSVCVSVDDVLFNRRIEFHPARKPFSGFALSGGDFHIETLNPSSDPAPAVPSGLTSSSAAGRRPDGVELHGSWLDPELSFGITFRRIGAGLANLGNTCFLNSVLQCLTYTEPFAAYLQSGKHKSSCHVAGFCAMCALQSHVMDALQSTGKILRPFNLVKNLRCISRNFRNSRQEDAHEYMINLLESMHKCCLPSGVASESTSAYEKSLVHKIFGGHLRSQVKCMECCYCSNKFDPFLDLSLEIVRADTLCKALSHFTSEEQLDGGQRQYQCQQCKQKVRALKRLTIHKAPYVLTIHLKRFGSHMHGQKIDKNIVFEPTLDLEPYMSCSEGDLKYTLYGVLVHAGHGTHSGHYFCFVRTSSGMWHSLNDHQVCQVSEKTVMQQKAYMLFYVRNLRNSTPKRALDLPSNIHALPTNGVVTKSQESALLADHVSHPSSKASSIEKTFSAGLSSMEATQQHSVVKGLCNVSSKDCESNLLEKYDLQKENPSKAESQEEKFQKILSSHKQDRKSSKKEALGKRESSKLKTQGRKSRDIFGKRRLPKSFYERSMLFGSRRLFLVAFNLQKRKFQVKQRLSAKENRKSGSLVRTEKGDQGTSTSMYVDSSSGRENDFIGSRDGNYVSGHAYAVDADFLGRKLDNNSKQRTWERGILEAHTSNNHSYPHVAMNLSKRGLWETPIPQWDGIKLPSELNAVDDVAQSIGYILDDWEMELDRGKRKKVRNAKIFSENGNPFQDLSAERARKKMKMNRTRSGSKPFRTIN